MIFTRGTTPSHSHATLILTCVHASATCYEMQSMLQAVRYMVCTRGVHHGPSPYCSAMHFKSCATVDNVYVAARCAFLHAYLTSLPRRIRYCLGLSCVSRAIL